MRVMRCEDEDGDVRDVGVRVKVVIKGGVGM